MAISDLVAGMIQGYGGSLSQQLAQKDQAAIRDRELKLNFLMETIKHPDLNPEGRQVVAGMLGQAFEEHGGENPLNFMQALSKVYEPAPSIKTTGGMARMGGGNELGRPLPVPTITQGPDRARNFDDPIQKAEDAYRSQLRVQGEEERRRQYGVLGDIELSGRSATEGEISKIFTGAYPPNEPAAKRIWAVRPGASQPEFMTENEVVANRATPYEKPAAKSMTSTMAQLTEAAKSGLGLNDEEAAKWAGNHLMEAEKLKKRLAESLISQRNAAKTKTAQITAQEKVAKRAKDIRASAMKTVEKLMGATSEAQRALIEGASYDPVKRENELLAQVLEDTYGLSLEELQQMETSGMVETLYSDEEINSAGEEAAPLLQEFGIQ